MECIINAGTHQDEMYIIIDGRVDAYVDLKQMPVVTEKNLDDFCNDLGLVKKDLKKQIFEFKEKTGLNNAKEVKKTIRQSMIKMMSSI